MSTPVPIWLCVIMEGVTKKAVKEGQTPRFLREVCGSAPYSCTVLSPSERGPVLGDLFRYLVLN